MDDAHVAFATKRRILGFRRSVVCTLAPNGAACAGIRVDIYD